MTPFFLEAANRSRLVAPVQFIMRRTGRSTARMVLQTPERLPLTYAAFFPSPLVGEGALAQRGRMSDYLGCQVALAYAARASRALALRRTSSLRARAMRMTIFSFPAATSLAWKSARLWS
jgi:hypothetical protein